MPLSSFHNNQRELEFSRSLGLNLKELTQEFLNNFQLSHAFLGKDYFDGHFFNISTDIPWKIITVDCDYHKDFSKKYLQNIKTKKRQSLFFMWERDSANPVPVLDHIYSHSGAISGFNILIPFEDHFENYGFASTKPVAEIYNNLPSLSELEMFCLYLQEMIISSSSFSQFALGFTGQKITPLQESPGNTRLPIPRKFTLTCDMHTAKLTHPEVLCLGFLANGYSQKDCARFLGISPRTVEYHLSQVKIKFNNLHKEKLITMFNTSCLGKMDLFTLLQSIDWHKRNR